VRRLDREIVYQYRDTEPQPSDAAPRRGCKLATRRRGRRAERRDSARLTPTCWLDDLRELSEGQSAPPCPVLAAEILTGLDQTRGEVTPLGSTGPLSHGQVPFG
jgi:hypothetical protein